MKYLKDWKNLPSFVDVCESDESIEGNYNVYINGDKENEEGGMKKGGRRVKEVPNFKELQEQFQADLERKKKEYKPTVIQEFNLASPRVKERSEAMTPKNSNIKELPKPPPSNLYIGSTLKY